MKRQNGYLTLLIFVALVAVLVMQWLSMIQSDRLYKRVNEVAQVVRNSRVRMAAQPAGTQPAGQTASGKEEGDWFVQHLSAEPSTLNMISVDASVYTNNVVMLSIQEPLFYYNLDVAGIELKPYLAKSLDISDDGLTFTVRLRDDIHFSDGHPITADDVIFTLNTIMDPGIDAPDMRNYYRNFKTWEKIDDKTIEFTFHELYWKTIESVGILEIFPEHIYQYDDPQEFNERRSDPVGSGPYVFERWDVGQQIVLKRNENYWGERPTFDKVVFKIITNDTAALQAFLNQQIDVLEPTPDQFAEKIAVPGFKDQFYAKDIWEPSVPFFFIGWNQKLEMFADQRVRLAMTHLIDRGAIVKHVLKGYAKVVTGPFYINGAQSAKDVEPWPYDVQHAKELLDQAGWVDTNGDGIRDKNGQNLRFQLSYSSGRQVYEQLVKLFKDSAAQAGVDVQPEPYEWSVYTGKINDRDFEACIMGWGGTIESDPYQIFHSSQIEGRGNNFVGYNSPRADELIETARRELDPQKRYALYHELHRVMHEEQPYTFLFTRPTFLFLDRRFENVIVHELGVDWRDWYVPYEKQKY